MAVRQMAAFIPEALICVRQKEFTWMKFVSVLRLKIDL